MQTTMAAACQEKEEVESDNDNEIESKENGE